jgi:hypothetical protein
MLKYTDSNDTSKHSTSTFRDVNYVDTKHTTPMFRDVNYVDTTHITQPDTLQKFIISYILKIPTCEAKKNYENMSIIVQQDATIYSLFMSVNCCTCFGWYLHPSSGAHITVSTESTITATSR